MSVSVSVSAQPQGTYSDLNSQQALACILGINGEFHGQTGRHTGGVETRTTGTHFTGIMGGQNLHLVGTRTGKDRTGGRGRGKIIQFGIKLQLTDKYITCYNDDYQIDNVCG